MSENPSLVEPDVLYFIENSLKKSHEYKMNTYSFFLILQLLHCLSLYLADFYIIDTKQNRPPMKSSKK